MNSPNTVRLERRCIRKYGGGVRPSDTGGKGWNLLRLRMLGFPVPPFVIVPSAMFEECVAPRRNDIASLLRTLRDGGNERIAEVSARIAHIIRGIVFPEDIRLAILKGYEDAAGSASRISVRSSVAGEDGAEHSFAGQMDSLLNVPRARVLDAVRRVWASAYSERALAYRLRAGLELQDSGIAVVLQRMLDARASGVLFTRDPVYGDKQCVITAGYGLGEGVVSDAVETDSYRIGFEGRELRRSVAVKSRAMRSADGEGVRVRAVDAAQRAQSVLNDMEILQLRDWGLQLESALSTPVDVEWARDADGALYLLQVRPITVVATQPRPVQVWDNANIVESYPGMTSPLTFSFIREAYARAFRGAIRGFLPRRAPLRQVDDVLTSLLGHVHGRVYYNLRSWYTMLSVLPGFERRKRAWDQMIGITQAMDIPAAERSLYDRAGTLVACAFRLLRVRGNARRFHDGFTRAYRRWSSLEIERADTDRLRAYYAMLADEAPRLWPRTLYNDFAAMTWYDLLKRCCDRWHCSDGLHNRLLCAEPGIESVQPVRALVRMAELVRGSEALRTLFQRLSDEQLLAALQQDSACATLRSELGAYLENYGDRGFEELKLESDSYRDDPAALIAMIRGYVDSGLTVERMERDERGTRERAEAELQSTVRHPLRRLLLRFVLNRARASVAARENMRFSRSRLYGLLRRSFRRYGELFAADGRLATARDVFYLEVDEVFSLASGALSVAQARRLVERRREQQEEDAGMSLPSRFLRDGDDGMLQSADAATAIVPVTDGSPEAGLLQGTGCSTGSVTAPCLIVHDPKCAPDVRGRILVARSTDPGWVFLMINAAGLIVEQGSVLSHTAIIGRELGIPTIVAASGAMRALAAATTVSMNGATGEIRWN